MAAEVVRHRRWVIQFSVRTLLIVMTICAIWLGIVSRRAREQRLAVDKLRELGGTVHYSYQVKQYDESFFPHASAEVTLPGWLVNRFGKDVFYSVDEIQFQTSCNINEMSTSLKSLRGVRQLTVNQPIPADVLEELKQTHPDMSVGRFNCVW